MNQVVQDLGSGETCVVDVPAPGVAPGHVLIETRASLISAGTERMLVEFGRANLVEKALQQPERVRQVLDKARTDGLGVTAGAVRSKLESRIPLGYCNAGVVTAVGEGVAGFRVGDRVVSNGPHAAYVRVPVNLCAPIPPGVDDRQAACAVLAAVGLQGIRLAEPTLGECFVVTGLGLVGLMTAQMLLANGCRVIGIDSNPCRLDLARQIGIDVVDVSGTQDAVAAVVAFSRGRGADGVIVTASTKSSSPITQAADMCRTRGRIVLVGVTGLELDRTPFYLKEITFQVSCSYGPGRYDPQYEQHGHDYPVGYVRWTEQRNLEAVLDMISTGDLDTDCLITHTYSISEAAEAYRTLSLDKSALGILLEYPTGDTGSKGGDCRSVALREPSASRPSGLPRLAVIGAGNYASRTLVPALAKTGAVLQTVVSANGLSASEVGRKYGFSSASTDSTSAITSPDVDAVMIATRHDSHAVLVVEALAAGKHVFVEKPLAITDEGLDLIEQAYGTMQGEARPIVTVGFNRRFAPLVLAVRRALEGAMTPSAFVVTVNAGEIPSDHWTQDVDVGGGRLIGEACHFIDLLRFLADAPIVRARSVSMSGKQITCGDTLNISLEFGDGSIGSIHYLANGHRSFPKERVEVFNSGRIARIDNFRSLKSWGWREMHHLRARGQDKGHQALLNAFVAALREGSASPVPFEQAMETSRCAIALSHGGLWEPGQ